MAAQWSDVVLRYAEKEERRAVKTILAHYDTIEEKNAGTIHLCLLSLFDILMCIFVYSIQIM